jgi:signal transduction histidine kinase
VVVRASPTPFADVLWVRGLSRRPLLSTAATLLCLVGLVALLLGDARAGPTTTFGGLQIIPLIAAGWLLSPLLALSLTLAAMALRVVAVLVGATSAPTGAIQCFVAVSVGLLTIAAADRAQVRAVMERRARGIRRLTRLLDAIRGLGAESEAEPALDEILSAATLLLTEPGKPPPRGTLARVEGHDVVVLLDSADQPGVVGQGFAVADNPAVARVLEDGGTATIRRQHLRGSARTLADTLGGRVFAVARVRALGRAHGVLVVTFTQERSFDPEELRLLEAMGHLAGIAIDAAAAVRLERHHSEDLRAHAERSAELEGMKREFLLLASHELRSPLAVARGYASMLRDGSLGEGPPQQRRALGILESKLEDIGALVDDMLETARLETGNLQLITRDVDLRDLVCAAVDTVQPVVTERHHLELELPGEPVVVRGDRERLRRIAVNLLDNAVKYSPDGGAVELSVGHDEQQALVSVRDHGLGIADHAMDRMFKRFGRIVTDRTSNIPGTGLGLYLCRELARAHGGDITVDSEEGEGSTFTLSLPLVGRAAD